MILPPLVFPGNAFIRSKVRARARSFAPRPLYLVIRLSFVLCATFYSLSLSKYLVSFVDKGPILYYLGLYYTTWAYTILLWPILYYLGLYYNIFTAVLGAVS